MGALVLTDARLYTGGADLTGASNKIEISSMYEDKDTTAYGSGGWKTRLGGLADTEIDAEGFWEAGDTSKVDDHTWAFLGGLGGWTICPGGASVGSLAYVTRAFRGEYKFLGGVGDVAPWSAGAKGSWPVARGVIAHPPGTARASSGNGTSILLGAAATGKSLYASLHVLSGSGTTPTLDVVVRSATDSGMTSPTDRITFTTASAVSGQIQRASGPITDTYYRVSWSVAGTTPSFQFVLSLGIA